jgi:tetratricopeptide (TPR) repeat protein
MNMINMKNIFLLSIALLLVSCDKFLDIQPTGKVIAKTGEEYRALLTGVYNTFPTDRSLTTLRTDEMILDKATITSEDYNTYFDIWTWNDITPDEKSTSWSWRQFYHTIYIASYVIDKQSEITDASAADINQIVGEAYMLRAYTYSILVNLFGKPYTKCDPSTELAVPLMVTPDVESVIGRSTVEAVYQQILSDINMAKQRLNVDKWEDALKYRFNKVSADALMARVCLYMGRWQEALDAAKVVIAAYPELEDLTTTTYTMPDKYTSKEAIVSLEQVMKSAYKGIGYPDAKFITSITTGDLRKNRYFKAKTSQVYDLLKGGANECRSTFRSAEFYLTAAEAAARLGKLEEAIDLMSIMVKNRYLAARQTTTINSMKLMTQDQLIDFILEDRRAELCFEGHRWFDLRRTTQPKIEKVYDDVTYILEEGDNRYTIVIPREAISANPLLSQEKK